MKNETGLHIFGFPLDIRPGFVMLLALFAVVYSGQGEGEFGIWLAVCVGVFTLLHELGHAFAARATGAEASIALDFLAGYASFEPTRPLKRWERAGISVAGPAVQIILGVVVLLMMGANPLDFGDIRGLTVETAVWWAGPVIGLINLAPILPLDGGHIVMSGLDLIIPGRSRNVMLYFSLALTTVALVFFTVSDYRLSPIFFIFPLVSQLQMLQHRHTQTALDRHGSWQLWAANAEAEAWTSGKVGSFPPGISVSPWFRAAELARRGNTIAARDLLVDDFSNGQSPNWLPPDGASARELEGLVALLPRPLSTGNVYSEYVLASILVRLGEFEAAGRYAAESYARAPGTMPAVIVAQCAAALDDDDLAIKWLRAGYDIGTNLSGLADAIEHRAEFADIRDRPEVIRLRHELAAAV
ncbi:MAG: site-2 protease family protein [Ilumatobacteraceae bacterium]